MRLTVTRVGTLRRNQWTVEYEIRDDEDRLLAHDYVHTRRFPSDSGASLMRLFNAYLAERLREWALADTYRHAPPKEAANRHHPALNALPSGSAGHLDRELRLTRKQARRAH